MVKQGAGRVRALELTMRDGHQTLLVPGSRRLVARLRDPPSGDVREQMLRRLAALDMVPAVPGDKQ